MLAEQRFEAIQKDLCLPQHSIIHDVPTCWNSTLHMLQRMLEQKPALNLYVAEHGKFTTPPAEQWDIISNVIDTLGPIEEATLDISKAEASISCIIPCIAVLKMVLQAEGHTTRGPKHSGKPSGKAWRGDLQRWRIPNVWCWQHCLILGTRVMYLQGTH